MLRTRMQELLRSGLFRGAVTIKYSECSSYSVRTHTCSQLGLQHLGARVTLAGWVQTSRLDKFILLRDRTGTCQIKIPEDDQNLRQLTNLPNESVVVVAGTVRQRPEGQENNSMLTGHIEVELEDVLETNKANPNLPFQQSKHLSTKEQLRLQYRYLDLRRPELQYNLAIRSALTMKMREFLVSKKFLDIETPTLFRRTPGGAKEFVVPTRLEKKYYSLVQSPQQFKQLLMVGGLDRYFQVARCYRDEGGRSDRQPEFTQLDIEMSFAGREEIIKLVEDLLVHCWPGQLDTPFEQMFYQDAIRDFGVDKPDLRYRNKIIKLNNCFQNSGFGFIEENLQRESFFIGGIFFSAPDSSCLKKVEKETRLAVSDLLKECKEKEEPLLISSYSSLESQTACSLLRKCDGAVSRAVSEAGGGDQVGFLVAGEESSVLPVLGRLRAQLARELLPDLAERPHKFVWVVDFPLFVMEEGKVASAHHPFTAAHPEDQARLRSDPLLCRSLHYDLVLNGQEVGGGSVRIHQAEDQRFVLQDVLQEDVKELHHLLTALGSGCPPHAGIALGLDRLVAIITKSNSIRDVIAFPKSNDGKDLMSGAPAEINEEQKLLYNLK